MTAPHEVRNGVLLRADLHRLLDQSYATITKDYRLEVSPRPKQEFENGRAITHSTENVSKVQGDSLRTHRRLRKALALYDSAVALAPRLAEVKARRDTFLAAIAIEEAKEQYIRDHLTLEHFCVGILKVRHD